MEKVEISKIVLKVGKKDVVLSLAEAKKLHDLMNDMFGKVVEVHHDNWYYRPYHPYYTYVSGGNAGLTFTSGTVLCDSTAGSLTLDTFTTDATVAC